MMGDVVEAIDGGTEQDVASRHGGVGFKDWLRWKSFLAKGHHVMEIAMIGDPNGGMVAML